MYMNVGFTEGARSEAHDLVRDQPHDKKCVFKGAPMIKGISEVSSISQFDVSLR